jgi:hypothetical protein
VNELKIENQRQSVVVVVGVVVVVVVVVVVADQEINLRSTICENYDFFFF